MQTSAISIYVPIGIWHVCTLRGVGHIHELMKELNNYTCDIIGLAETRWKHSGEIIGRFALGKSNQRGNRLLEYCTKNNLIIANILHPQNNSQKSTWPVS